MPLDLINSEDWESLNSQVQDLLGVPSGCTVRLYKGASHALFEIIVGLVQFAPHKKKFSMIKGATPFFEPLLPYLYKDSYELLDAVVLDADLVSWSKALSSDANFVFCATDHLVMGTETTSPTVIQNLNEKKIYTISLSHRSWLRDAKQKNWNLNPFEIRVLALGPELAVMVAGSRFRCPSLISGHMPWAGSEALRMVEGAISKFTEDEAFVRNVERFLPHPWVCGIHTKNRLYDRAFIFNTHLNSDAVYAPLSKIWPRESFEILSLCRQGALPNFYNWWLPQIPIEALRGGLVVELDVLRRPTFAQELQQASFKMNI